MELDAPISCATFGGRVRLDRSRLSEADRVKAGGGHSPIDEDTDQVIRAGLAHAHVVGVGAHAVAVDLDAEFGDLGPTSEVVEDRPEDELVVGVARELGRVGREGGTLPDVDPVAAHGDRQPAARRGGRRGRVDRGRSKRVWRCGRRDFRLARCARRENQDGDRGEGAKEHEESTRRLGKSFLRLVHLRRMSLRARIEDLAAALLALVDSGVDGLALGQRRAAAIEAIVVDVFTEASTEVEAPLAVAAVGSFGRRALALRSDVDLLLFVPAKKKKESAAFVDALLYPLWDAKVPLSHQTLAEDDAIAEAERDLATATALLDARVIAGDPMALHKTQARFRERLASGGSRALLDRLEADVRERQARYGESVHLLEPDVKNSDGGLRDLDVARWAMRVATGTVDEDPSALALVRGLVDEREIALALDAERFLHRTRNRLHALAGRRSDRLTFDLQERLAAVLEPGDPAEEVGARTERFMQRYYHHGRAVDRLRDRVFARLRPAPSSRRAIRAAEGVELRGDYVQHTVPCESDPALPLRIVRAASNHGRPIAEATRDAIARAAGEERFAAAMRASTEAQDAFVELVCSAAEAPFRGGSIAAELADLGLLVAMIPEFLPVIARVHHDVYHVYTVDAHSVAALDRLRAIARGDLAEEFPLATRLGAEIERRRPLFFATLLHDVGKGYPDADGSRKNHAQRGAELCRVVLPRLRLSAAETEDAARLVDGHLALYHAATRRDVDDANTLDEVARIVRNREGLRDLYLLTVADVSTTSPTALSAWKAKMLDELYLRCDGFLGGARGATADAAQRERAFAAVLGGGTGPTRDAVRAFIDGMPSRYLLGTTPARLARHVATWVALGDRATWVESTDDSTGDGDVVELCVVAEDRPGLLARIAAALTASGLEVLGANVFTRVDAVGGAVDLFHVGDPHGGTAAVRAKVDALRASLEALARGELDADALVRSRGRGASPWARATPAVRTEVAFDQRASDADTVVEVFAKDRPGLLFRLARTLEDLKLSIAFSRINTEGTKVSDVFYVHEMDGSKVEGRERLAEVRDRLLAAVHGEDP